MSAPASTRSIIIVFAFLMALMASGYGVMFTVLDDFREQYGIQPGALGFIVAIGFFSSFLAQIFLAPLADRGYARRLVVLGLAAQVAGLITLAFGSTVAVLAIGRIVMGLGAGMFTPAVRRIVILSDRGNLGTNLGRLLAADVAGFASGPAISALIVGPLGIAAPFLLIAGATVAAAPLALRVRVDEAEIDEHAEPPARFAFDLLGNRPYVGALALGAALFLMIGTFDALWAVLFDDLGASDLLANLGIVGFALPFVVLGPLGGRISQRYGPFRVGALGMLIGAAFIFSYGQFASPGLLFALALLHSLNDSLTVSSAGIAVGMVVPPSRQAGAQGLLGGVQTLTAGLSALMAGALYEGAGQAVAYGAAAALMVALVVVARIVAASRWTDRPVAEGLATHRGDDTARLPSALDSTSG